MAVVKEKTMKQMAFTADCPTHARTHVHAGKHTLVIDEPSARGGTDQGPTPIETMIAALLGCTNVTLNRVAEANYIAIHSLALQVETNFDRRGVTLQEEVAVPFPEMYLTIDLVSPASDAEIENLKLGLRKFCPISKVIRQSGTKLEEIWHVRRS